MKEGYCTHCNRHVSLTKGGFNWWFFIFTAWCGIGEIYLVIYWLKKYKYCKLCGCEVKR